MGGSTGLHQKGMGTGVLSTQNTVWHFNTPHSRSPFCPACRLPYCAGRTRTTVACWMLLLQAGFGKDDATGECKLCAIGTYAPGPPEHKPSASISSEATNPLAAKVQAVEACLPCSDLGGANGGTGFTTLTAGATSASQCICLPG